jgi:hypothetical protein
MFNPDPGSDFFPSRIPDPGSELSPSRITDPHKRILVFKQKKGANGLQALKNIIRIVYPGSGC